jgi:hypothetical protein
VAPAASRARPLAEVGSAEQLADPAPRSGALCVAWTARARTTMDGEAAIMFGSSRLKSANQRSESIAALRLANPGQPRRGAAATPSGTPVHPIGTAVPPSCRAKRNM